MYATVCQTNHNFEKDIALMLICGFMGSLKGWWKNYLTPIQRNKILTSVKIEVNEAGEEIQKPNILYTLIQSIVYHFIGTVSSNVESQRYLLQNLKCVSLAHFRWYKDIFLAKVMGRSDANSAYWKAKLLMAYSSYLLKG